MPEDELLTRSPVLTRIRFPKPFPSQLQTRALTWVPALESISAKSLAQPSAICRQRKSLASSLPSRPVALGIFSFVARAKPQGGGSIDNIAAVEIPNQNAVLVAVNVTVHNSGEKALVDPRHQGKNPDRQW